MTRTGNTYEKWLRGDNTVYVYNVWLWFLGSALTLIAICLYTKFDLNGNCSFKVICRIMYRDGQTKRRLYAKLLWNIYNYMQCLITNIGSVGQYRLRSKWHFGWFGGQFSGVAVKLADVVLSWVADVEDCGNLAWQTWKHVLIPQWENESDTSALVQSSSLQTQDINVRGQLSPNCGLGRTLHAT